MLVQRTRPRDLTCDSSA